MELREFIAGVSNFGTLTQPERIRHLAWFLHTHRRRERFDKPDIRECYDELHLASPDLSIYFPRLTKQGMLLKDKQGFRLERGARLSLDSKYGQSQITVVISKLLGELPTKVPDVAEQDFLREALSCYKARAFRATIVMTWNLAFHHLLTWILSSPPRLADFNNAIPARYPKKAGVSIAGMDHFEDFKESEIIEIARTANLISKSVKKILLEKLDKRNTAAHPSSVIILQPQADEIIVDLVNNVVLKLT